MKEKNALNISGLLSFLFALLIIFSCCAPSYLYAQDIPEDKKDIFSNSGYPIPRFVSLAKDITNVRAGPGQKYPVKWVITKQGLPVEIILEFDHWRKIKDYDGEEGWVFKSLLSGKRTGFIMGGKAVNAYEDQYSVFDEKGQVSVMLEPQSLVEISSCEGTVCHIAASGLSGWIERKSLWGVYEKENFD
tara:strand:- start:53840 stop:54406 length:567 start_codon:yes stop_codon:yes gene_type:complete